MFRYESFSSPRWRSRVRISVPDGASARISRILERYTCPGAPTANPSSTFQFVRDNVPDGKLCSSGRFSKTRPYSRQVIGSTSTTCSELYRRTLQPEATAELSSQLILSSPLTAPETCLSGIARSTSCPLKLSYPKPYPEYFQSNSTDWTSPRSCCPSGPRISETSPLNFSISLSQSFICRCMSSVPTSSESFFSSRPASSTSMLPTIQCAPLSSCSRVRISRRYRVRFASWEGLDIGYAVLASQNRI